jgi:hypothetical protein
VLAGGMQTKITFFKYLFFTVKYCQYAGKHRSFIEKDGANTEKIKEEKLNSFQRFFRGLNF